MKVNQLIKLLKELPQEMDVVVFDHRKNLCWADEDGSTEGIDEIKVVGELRGVYTDTGDPGNIVIISFNNNDYKDDGTIEWGSALVAAVEKECID